jgi:cysteine dioxygenase
MGFFLLGVDDLFPCTNLVQLFVVYVYIYIQIHGRNHLQSHLPLTTIDTQLNQHTNNMTETTVPHYTSLDELTKHILMVTEDGSIDVKYLKELLANYEPNLDDFQRYLYTEPNTYTRNLIHEGNGHLNLILLWWDKNSGSKIHNHPNSNCLMKCLDGELTETQYVQPSNDQPMQVLATNELNAGDVTYIHDTIGLHRVHNPSSVKPAMTLHLYIPPYAKCNVYDPETGRVNGTPQMTFHTKFGERNSSQ